MSGGYGFLRDRDEGRHSKARGEVRRELNSTHCLVLGNDDRAGGGSLADGLQRGADNA